MHSKRKTAATIAALMAVMPTVACAKGSGQGTVQNSAEPRPGATAGGMTLAQFETRRGGRMLAADSDGDGRVSRAEFAAAQQGRSAKHGGDPASRFDRLDANRDGFIDKREIDALLARRFRRMDADGNGVVTRDERAAMRQGAGSARGNLQPDRASHAGDAGAEND